MSRWKIALLLLVVIVLAVLGWRWFTPGAATGPARGPGQDTAAAPVPVTVVEATTRDVPVHLDALGTVQALNQTVNYAEGSVFGLTRTSVCAEPGDSGGSFIAGNSAQGMTSGGSGDCTFGGTTYFQPIGPALTGWGLTLVTG